MSKLMNIVLSETKADSQWGENALTSAHQDGITIHLNPLEEAFEQIQKAGRQLQSRGISAAKLTGDGWSLENQWSFAKGFSSTLQKHEITWASLDASESTELENRYKIHNWVRTIIQRPANDLSPVQLAEEAAQFLTELAPESVTYSILQGDELKAENLIGIHTVGRGSVNPPALLKLEYCPESCKEQPVAAALVGKGITFDSGGYSMKPSDGMVGMKADMGGAANVTGGLALAITRGIQKKVNLYLCCAENMVSGQAYRLGDILTYKNGVTVEILNTDAEGRLVLADGLILAGESGAPLIVDGATLTGAAKVAVGRRYNALFMMDDALQQKVLACAQAVNERLWPLPLEKWHQSQCPSHYADTANVARVKGTGDASNAAGFLARFVPREGKGWVHLDMCATVSPESNDLWAAGATGQGIHTIARLLQDLA